MSDNLTISFLVYSWLRNIRKQNFQNNSVILIGTGLMAEQHAFALNQLKIHNVQVVSYSTQQGKKFCKQFGFEKHFSGGYEKNLHNLDHADLVILCLPIPLLLDATQKLLKNNFSNILIEKPGSLYDTELLKLSRIITNQNVRIGYNRLLYPSFLKLKSILCDEETTSCHFEFTEWTHRIIFNKYASDVYQRWGISNSLHPISMAFELIGMPKKLTAFRSGKLNWHKTGSVFVGSGISEYQIPFSYHANWESAGRWMVEIMTKKAKYRLSPLEELHFCRLGETTWHKIKLNSPYPKIKVGLAEEIISMLSNDPVIKGYLPSLKKAASYNKTASKIFGYK